MSSEKFRPELISIIVPCYNEAARILPTLNRINKSLKSRFNAFEVIVVNDGSTDNTEAIVLKALEEISALNYITYKDNQGKGHALREGVKRSKGDLVLLTDADLSAPIEDLVKLLVWYDKGFDIVIGSRALAESQIVVRQPWWRESMGKIFNGLVRSLLLKDFMDTQCGFKLFNGNCARNIFKLGKISRFAYDVEILFLGKKMGYKIKEVAVNWFNSPSSKVNPIKDSFQMAKDLVKISLKKKKYYPHLF